MNRVNLEKIITKAGIVLIPILIGVLFGFWLENFYNQPKIGWLIRPEYKIDNFTIGSIYLVNSGRKTDHSITLTLNKSIKTEDIKIAHLTSDYKIKNNYDKTNIIIQELKPNEEADITYIDRINTEDLGDIKFISESGRISSIRGDIVSNFNLAKIIFGTILTLFMFFAFTIWFEKRLLDYRKRILDKEIRD